MGPVAFFGCPEAPQFTRRFFLAFCLIDYWFFGAPGLFGIEFGSLRTKVEAQETVKAAQAMTIEQFSCPIARSKSVIERRKIIF